MYAPWKRLASTFAAVCVALLVVLFTGCEKIESQTTQADRAVTGKLQEGRQAMSKGAAGLAQAQQALADATAIAAASPAVRLIALDELAQLEVESANLLINEINCNELAVSGLISEIQQLALRIQVSTQASESYRKLNPDAILKKLDEKIVEVRGSAEKLAWISNENTEIPTLSAIKQKISSMEGEIAKRQEQIKALAAQRTQAIEEAEKTAQLVLAQQDGKSVQLGKRVAELRKQAANLANEIELTTAAIEPFRNDLAIAQGQQTVLNEMIEQFQQQAAQAKQQWEQIQKQIESQTILAKNILNGPPEGGASKLADSIQGKVAEMAKLLEQIEKSRSVAVASLQNAAKHYAQAVQVATVLRTELGNKSGETANKGSSGLGRIYSPTVFIFQQGVVVHRLAVLSANEAASLNNRLQLAKTIAPVFAAANLTVPWQLSEGTLANDCQKALASAETGYTQASGFFQVVTTTPGVSPDQVRSAHVARIFTCYGQSEVQRIAGKADAAKQALDDAIAAKTEALNRSAILPTLPAALSNANP